MSDTESVAKSFAEQFGAFAAMAAKVSEIEDIGASHDDAAKRLANRKLELEAATRAVEDARAQAEGIVSTAKAAAGNIVGDANAKAGGIVEAAQKTARQIIADATGDANSRNEALKREVADQQSILDRLRAEIEGHVSQRQSALSTASEAQSALDAIKAELSALKARF